MVLRLEREPLAIPPGFQPRHRLEAYAPLTPSRGGPGAHRTPSEGISAERSTLWRTGTKCLEFQTSPHHVNRETLSTLKTTNWSSVPFVSGTVKNDS
jgi:hypothetical protein